MNYQSTRVLSVLLKKDFIKNISHCKQIHLRSAPKCKTNLLLQNGSFLRFSDCPPKCWQCDYPHKSELFCSKCKALQKFPEDLNYFDIIGVRKDFDIPLDEVQKKYKKLQTLLHPDRYGQKSDKEKEISENLSSLVNKAYTTLIHPLDRGLYMLKLHKISIPEETTSLNPEFLMEIMEKNEEIEEAAEDKEKTLKLLNENRATLTSLTKQVSAAFHNEDFDQAKGFLIKMKYYISIENTLKKLKQDLGIVE